MNVLKKELMTMKGAYKIERKWFRLAFILLPVIAVIAVLLPRVLLRLVNKQLGKIKGYYGFIEKLHIGSKKIVLHNFLFDKLDAKTGGRNKFISCKKVEIEWKWKHLWEGMVITDVIINNPVYTYLNTEDEKPAASQPTEKKKSNITHLNVFPFIVNKLEIKNATVEYIDTLSSPIVRLDISKIYVRAHSVSNIPEFNIPAQVMLLGQAYGGMIKINGKVQLQKPSPAFDVNAEIENIELSRLNNLFDAYGKFTINAGELSLYTEVAAAEGRFKGYVKPVISNIDIAGKNEENQTLWRSIWESVVGTAIKIFENSKEEQLATKIPIEGKFSDPEINVWYAIVQTLRNAFVSALTPSIDFTINFGSLKQKGNSK